MGLTGGYDTMEIVNTRGDYMHIFITGGTRGIGLGLVQEFSRMGHVVSFTGTSDESIEKALIKIREKVFGLVCDVRNHILFEQVVVEAIKKNGPIDMFINNAGIDQRRLTIDELSGKEIKKVVDINVTGMMVGTKIALEHMKQLGKGAVYNMEGLGSNNMMIPKTIVYGSSKRLLTYFSKACNKELKTNKDVFVGTLQPGMVFTDLLLNELGEDGLKVARIIGSKVEDVVPYLVRNMLRHKKTIKYLKWYNIMWRFVSSPFVTRNKDVTL